MRRFIIVTVAVLPILFGTAAAPVSIVSAHGNCVVQGLYFFSGVTYPFHLSDSKVWARARLKCDNNHDDLYIRVALFEKRADGSWALRNDNFGHEVNDNVLPQSVRAPCSRGWWRFQVTGVAEMDGFTSVRHDVGPKNWEQHFTWDECASRMA